MESIINNAQDIKVKYNSGQINLSEAKKLLKKYGKFYEKRSKEISVKYNKKPQKFNVMNFLRSPILK